ncbi:DUF4258 domain-containing protein [Snuella sedimenti]|uniref:DUF4258 domain-containing protein n=1 Tax=Snuella sedimenti TaxID=2798802 RepID=A0A8J7LSP8_9FLAO|nr:DUF4258 domain-containing protein [Snuella sedimenti]MBJ6368655.1 DUF4258 domain-containing protein [Snuella sedimenti]
MTLLQRIGYYLGGFSLGLIILAFFLNGKKTSCSYGPEARVIKNINSKKILFNSDIQDAIASKTIDSSAIRYILKRGDIDFSKSETHKKPCATYIVQGLYNENDIALTVENCDSIATVISYSKK